MRKNGKICTKANKAKMDNKKANLAIAIYRRLWYNIIVPRERETEIPKKKISRKFQKGIDKHQKVWYNKRVPKIRGQKPKTKKT